MIDCELREASEGLLLPNTQYSDAHLYFMLLLLTLSGTRTKIEVLHVTENLKKREMNKSANGDVQLNGDREREKASE